MSSSPGPPAGAAAACATPNPVYVGYARDVAWLRRARVLAERAARVGGEEGMRDTLYRGDIGIALLVTDFESPEGAFMPFFEEEGAPARPTR